MHGNLASCILVRSRYSILNRIWSAAWQSSQLSGRSAGEVVDVLVRRRGTANPMEVRVAIIGNVDSGKSTMVGVLTRSMLDDGRGLARSKVFKHNHEEATGRTSSIGQHNLCVSFIPSSLHISP